MTDRLDPVSNAETWQDTIEFYDDDDGEAFFPEGSPPDEITMKLRDPDSGEIVLSGALSTGELVVSADGVVNFTFSKAAMNNLYPKQYEVGVLYTDEGVTRQAILGTISILSGL